jgi:spore maturation protein CgeB
MKDLLERFPQAVVAGPDWPIARLDANAHYARSKIGWNFTNNAVGPNNSRTVHLPGMGVMQICDNPEHLRRVFTLDREVIAFTSSRECIEKTEYYLHHDRERREIAVRGWKRALADYSEEQWWRRLLNRVAPDFFA